MSDYDKLWMQHDLNTLAVNRANELIQTLGMALPCRVTAVNGAIVTVALEVQSDRPLPLVTLPKAESPWIRMPTQVGDFGVTMPASVYLGGISGLGGGTASMTQPGNLSALIFVPVSNANSPPANTNMAYVQGPDGATIQTTTGTTSSVVTDTSGTTVTFGSNTLTVNGSEINGAVGSSSIQMTGISITLSAGGSSIVINASGVTIDGILFDTHIHGGVTTGGSVTTRPLT